MAEIPQIEQIEAWLEGRAHQDHDTFAMGREFAADLMDEITTLRSVVVFADGFVTSQTGQFGDHQMSLADLYNDTCAQARVIDRAGCHPRGSFRKSEQSGHGPGSTNPYYFGEGTK